MPGRPRHPDKDLERVLRALEQQGWRVTRGQKYFKAWCPCEARHWKTIHLTPSSSGYRQNLVGQLRRATCWQEEAR